VARPVQRDDEQRDDRDRRRGRSREDDRERGRSRREREEDEYEDEDEGRPGRHRPGTCPTCGSGRSKNVSYTWWGGIIGPAIFHQVRCLKCGQNYNTNTGKPIGAVQVIVYSAVILAILGGGLLALRLAFAA